MSQRGQRFNRLDESQVGISLMDELDQVDIQSIIDNNDISQLEQYLPLVIVNSLQEEDFEKMNSGQKVKLIQLGQLILEYLGFSNKYLNTLQSNLNQQHKDLIQKEKEIDQNIEKQKQKYRKLKVKVQSKKEKLKNLKIQRNKPHFRCQFCHDKVFVDEQSLDNHVMRRHPEKQYPIGNQINNQQMMYPTMPVVVQQQVEPKFQGSNKDEIQGIVDDAMKKQTKQLKQQQNQMNQFIEDIQKKNQEKENKINDNHHKQSKDVDSKFSQIAQQFQSLQQKMDQNEQQQKILQKKQQELDRIEREKQQQLKQKQQEYEQLQRQLIKLNEKVKDKKFVYYSGVLESDHDSEEMLDEQKVQNDDQQLDLTDLYEKEREFLYLKSTKGQNKMDETEVSKVKDTIQQLVHQTFYKTEQIRFEQLYQLKPEQCENILNDVRLKLNIDSKQFVNRNQGNNIFQKLKQNQQKINQFKNIEQFERNQKVSQFMIEGNQKKRNQTNNSFGNIDIHDSYSFKRNADQNKSMFLNN